MKRGAAIAGIALAAAGWVISGVGMTGHMAGHMIAVAVAAPLLAFGLNGTAFDAALRWPRVITPMAMMLVELVIVWGWHLPVMRAAADANAPVAAVEHASFLVAGFALWSAVIHASGRASGIGALLLTSMHMTLLGALVGLAPRPLYAMDHAAAHMHGGLDPLADQQLSGVVMLIIGGASYLAGGLALLAGLLRDDRSISV